MGKPNWISWIEYLQQHTRHYESLTLQPHEVAQLLKHLQDNDRKRLEVVDNVD